MSKMSESGFAGLNDEQDLKGNMKKKNINTYYSGNKNPENLIIREILIQIVCWQSWRVVTRNPVETLRYE